MTFLPVRQLATFMSIQGMFTLLPLCLYNGHLYSDIGQ